MLAININSNPTQIKKNVIAGMSGREALFSFIALAIAISITAALYFIFHIEMYIGMNVSIFACIPVMMHGFSQKNGITLREKVQVSMNKKKGGIGYEANEITVVPVSDVKNEAESEIEKQAEFQKTVKTMKLLGIALIIMAIVIGIILVAILK